MTTFELVPQGPFSLTASAAFLEGFSPAAHRGAEGGHLHLAFVPDGEEAAAGVCLRQPDGVVVGEVFGEADPEGVPEQVARILSLDVDGSGFPQVGRRDPVVGGCRGAGRGCGLSGSSRRTRRPPGR
jgi:DNA-3-methyladenine glycosylase II